jgi:penicillin-binding protein 1A
VSAPIFRDFMKGALADAPSTPFRVASGIEEVSIDWKSGDSVPSGTPGAITEAFKAGTAPGEANAPSLATVTAGDTENAPVTVGGQPGIAGQQPAPQRGAPGVIGEGTGGLY